MQNLLLEDGDVSLDLFRLCRCLRQKYVSFLLHIPLLHLNIKIGVGIKLKNGDRIVFVNTGVINFSMEKMAALEGITQE